MKQELLPILGGSSNSPSSLWKVVFLKNVFHSDQPPFPLTHVDWLLPPFLCPSVVPSSLLFGCALGMRKEYGSVTYLPLAEPGKATQPLRVAAVGFPNCSHGEHWKAENLKIFVSTGCLVHNTLIRAGGQCPSWALWKNEAIVNSTCCRFLSWAYKCLQHRVHLNANRSPGDGNLFFSPCIS